MIDSQLISAGNAQLQDELDRDFDFLAEKLRRQGVDVETVLARLMDFEVATPSWGVGTGGTRFARFPQAGEPRHIFDKLEDCAVIHQLVRVCPRVSPHFPWDEVDDAGELREAAASLGLGFDAVNSNTFQDQPGQEHSYKYGSLSHTNPAVRQQAIAHNIGCIELGKAIGSKALTVWVGDGANHPGQQDFTGALERYLESMRTIYDALPDDWSILIEHKMFEPSFYATVIADWGTSILCAQTLGEKARCLVDLGHHAPNTNIEMIVARLSQFGKLGGFHFNDSKYGDDDLDSGSIDPFRLFLVFHELVKIEAAHPARPSPAYMLDQSHNVTDPIESLIVSAESVALAYAAALLVDQPELSGMQADNDALGAARLLREAYRTDVRPLIKMARLRVGGAIDPIAVFRQSGYRAHTAEKRPKPPGGGGGIV